MQERERAAEEKPILAQLTGITKTFGPTVALAGVDVTIRGGEVLGLVGENGSGKSTVTSIFAGMQQPDSGRMTFRGGAWHPTSMHDALKKGVGMIVQESGTVPGITVAENLFLADTKRFASGREGGGLLNSRDMKKQAQNALDAIGATHIRPDTVTASLDLQDRKLIEVARVMYHTPDIMIVDETTTALSRRGREIIYDLIRRMRDSGRAVVFISHDLDEIKSTCDTLTVLRDGRIIRSFEKQAFDDDSIRQSMIGRKPVGDYYRTDTEPTAAGELALSAHEVTCGDTVRGVTLDAHKGEILGIGGLSQCGMHTLGKLLFGAVRPDSGTVTVGTTPVRSPADAMQAGAGYASKDRDTESLCAAASVRDNITVACLDSLSEHGFVTPRRLQRCAETQIRALSVKCPGADTPVSLLSGGNKQKVVFGKWLARGSDVLILDCPTRGIDIGVKQTMYRLMTDMKRAGKTVIIISEELPELIGMSDRLIIMKNGQISGEFRRGEMTEAAIIRCMV